MAYIPKGHVKTILDGMAAQDPGLEWSTEEVAALAGIHKNAVTSTLRTAGAHGLVFTDKRGRNTFYSLTTFVTEEPEEAPEFKAALWSDGDLVVYGAQANEDGSFTVTRDQLAEVKKLIAWSPAA